MLNQALLRTSQLLIFAVRLALYLNHLRREQQAKCCCRTFQEQGKRHSAAMMVMAMMYAMMRQAESAGLKPLFQSGWLLSCHRPGCGFIFCSGGTVSRKLSSSPFHFKVKQRRRIEHCKRSEEDLREHS